MKEGCDNLTARNYKTMFGHYMVCEECISKGHMHIPDTPAPVHVGSVKNATKCQCEHASHYEEDYDNNSTR